MPPRTQGWLAVDAEAARPVAAELDALAGGGAARRLLARLGPIRRLVAWEARDAGIETVRLELRGA